MNPRLAWRTLGKGAADIALILAVLFTIGRLTASTPSTEPPLVPLRLGVALELKSVDWNAAPRHVVLALSSTCPACLRSGEFYKELSSRLPSLSARLVVVASDPQDIARKWLDERGIVADEVLQTSLRAAGFNATPTLLIVNRLGQITDIVTGIMDSEQQGQFYERLSGRRSVALDNMRRIEPLDLERYQHLAREGGVHLVDVRERGEYAGGFQPGSINIPYDEIAVRAPAELLLKETIVIDCRKGRMARCEIAWEALDDLGVSRLFMLTAE